MKIFIAIFIILTLTACTHTKVSDITLLNFSETKPEKTKNELQKILINIDAYKKCTSYTSGYIKTTTCSSLPNIKKIVNIFNENGFKAIPNNDEKKSAPHIVLKTDHFNPFLRGITGFLNYITLGFSPRYDYDDYIVSYKDPIKNIDIIQKVRVSSTKSWFSLFTSNYKGLKGWEIRRLAEKNLIKNVLKNAEINNK